MIEFKKNNLLSKNIHIFELDNFEISEDLSKYKNYIALLVEKIDIKIFHTEISNFIKYLLDSGMIYLSTFGNNCELIHDLADDIITNPSSNYENLENDSLITTTWHTNETIEETLDFMINCANPSDNFLNNTKNILIFVINDSKSLFKLKNYLSKNYMNNT
jgi:hypothetical protein